MCKLCKCNLIKAIWMPDYILDNNRENVIRVTLRKFIFYLIFLIVTIIVVFSMFTPILYTFTKVLRAHFLEVEFESGNDAFIQFYDIHTAADFWKFTESMINNSLYNEFWYGSNTPIAPTSDDDEKVLYENKILGVPRLRQLRVSNDSCHIHESFRRSFHSCYASYKASIEDKSSFGPGLGSAWTYHTQQELNGSYYTGKVGYYSGAGYYQDLSLEKNDSIDMIKTLKENLWIGRNTRVVFFDFTLYNGNINLFSVIKFVFEFPPTGGVLPSHTFYNVRLLRYVDVHDHIVMGCEFLFITFIIYYMVEEILEFQHYRSRFFSHWWNYIDITIIIISMLCIAFSIYRWIFVRHQIHAIELNPDIYTSFEFVGYFQLKFDHALAITLFLLWIKIFKFINLSQTLGQLNATLSRCSMDIVGFSFMFFIVFFAFSQVGYLLFGSEIERFCTFSSSVITLLITILGEFDYYEIEQTNKILAPIFFTSYIFFVFFVLFNMFLAIITDTYSDVKDEITLRKSELEVFDFIKRAPQNLLLKCSPKFRLEQKYLPGNAIIDDIRAILELCKFNNNEIQIFFSLYNIDPKKPNNENDVRKLLADLQKSEKQGSSTSKGKRDVTTDEFISQQKRLEKLDEELRILRTKVDDLLNYQRSPSASKAP